MKGRISKLWNAAKFSARFEIRLKMLCLCTLRAAHEWLSISLILLYVGEALVISGFSHAPTKLWNVCFRQNAHEATLPDVAAHSGWGPFKLLNSCLMLRPKYILYIYIYITPLWGVLPSAKRPEGRAARGRPGNVWQLNSSIALRAPSLAWLSCSHSVASCCRALV